MKNTATMQKKGGGHETAFPRFAGWWGNDPSSRFKMENKFVPAEGAAGWQLSNAPVFSMAVHKAALDIFDEAGISGLREKSELLTGYLEFIIKTDHRPQTTDHRENPLIKIITPTDKNQRGCQLSLVMAENGKKIHEDLLSAGIITDWRNPDVIRLAPVPLYNSFEDVWKFGDELKKIIHTER